LLKAFGVLLCALLFAAGLFWTAAVFTYPELVAIVGFGVDEAEDEAKDQVYEQILQNSADTFTEEQPPAGGKHSSVHAIEAARKRQLGALGFLAVLWAKFTDIFYGEFRGQKAEPTQIDPCAFQGKTIGPSGQSRPCVVRRRPEQQGG
jgi:hypothetical protein